MSRSVAPGWIDCPRPSFHTRLYNERPDSLHRPLHDAARGPAASDRPRPIYCRSRIAAHAACGVRAQPARACAHQGDRYVARRRRAGVAFVLTGPELVRELPPVSDTQLALPSKWTALVQHNFINPQQPLLAHDKVRHVGEAVAVIVAESRYAAEDAAQLVELDLEPLPPVLDPEQALEAGATIVHDKFSTNLIGAFTAGKGDAAAALARAPPTLKRRFHHHRYAAMPMECRGVVGLYDHRTDSVTIWSAT